MSNTDSVVNPQWGEPRPDCPRCHGTGTYRLTPDSRLRPCRCGLSERSEAAGGEATGQIIVKHYPVMFTPPGTDENGTPPLVDVLAGLSDEARVQTDGYSYHALGPKTRATLREAVQELASLRQQLAAAREDVERLAREKLAIEAKLAARNVKDGKIWTPWTDDQVRALNDWQLSENVHPYTCGECRRDLIATNDGWWCPRCCRVVQDWARDFSAARSEPSGEGGNG